MRVEQIERRLIVAELLLDGLFTHANFKPGCMRPIHHKRIGKALSAIRGARDILRHDAHSRQWTLTTTGGAGAVGFNRGKAWICNAVPEWKCDCNLPFKTKGIHKHKILTKRENTLEKLKDDKHQTRISNL